VFWVFAALSNYRTAAVTSTENYDTADTRLQLAKMEWENAKECKEYCVGEYMKFRGVVYDIVTNMLQAPSTLSADGQQTHSKTFTVIQRQR
jgi:hypothetical protein